MSTLHLIRRAEELILGRNDVELHRAVTSGSLVRIGPGLYAPTAEWSELEPMDQHRARVLEAARRCSQGTVFSHYAAAAIWGIRLLGAWPTMIDITTGPATGGRSSGRFRRHGTVLSDDDVQELDGVTVTSPAQTVVDLARVLAFTDAVVALDSALHRKRKPFPLTTRDQIGAAIASTSGRGSARAAASFDFSTDLSDSPEETHSRVQIHVLGFPPPELQHQFVLRSGKTADTDFFWESFDHAGECDGRAKYRDPKILRGRRPEDVVIDEKNRENELRRVVSRLSRWEPSELYRPREFYDRLIRDGLPSSKPRP